MRDNYEGQRRASKTKVKPSRPRSITFISRVSRPSVSISSLLDPKTVFLRACVPGVGVTTKARSDRSRGCNDRCFWFQYVRGKTPRRRQSGSQEPFSRHGSVYCISAPIHWHRHHQNLCPKVRGRIAEVWKIWRLWHSNQ